MQEFKFDPTNGPDAKLTSPDGAMIKSVCLANNGHIQIGTDIIPTKRTVTTVDPTVNDDVTTGYIIGSLWYNTTTDKAFICLDDADGAAVWTDITQASGGDVSSSTNITDHALVRGDGGAKGIQGSGITVDDSDNMSGVNSLGNVDYVDFDTAASEPTATEARLFYDNVEDALSYKPGTPSLDVTVNIGQENLIRVKNNTGSTITNGQACYINGADTGVPTVALSQADAPATAHLHGLATHDIPNGTIGFLAAFGLVRDVDTSSFSEGVTVYVSDSVAGGLTTTPPNLKYMVGTIVTSHATTGKIFVHAMNSQSSNAGSDCQQQTSTTNSTTSTTWTDTGLSVTAMNEGTAEYDIILTCNITNATKGKDSFVIINIGGSDVAVTQRKSTAGESNNWTTASIHYTVSVNDGDIIKVRFKTEDGPSVECKLENSIFKICRTA